MQIDLPKIILLPPDDDGNCGVYIGPQKDWDYVFLAYRENRKTAIREAARKLRKLADECEEMIDD